MWYINYKNIYTSVMVLAVVPTVVQIWLPLYSDTIWRKTWDFLAICNVTGLSIPVTILHYLVRVIVIYIFYNIAWKPSEDLVRK